MSKRIFSITCTTCHARLAIRSESVVGAILECPQCQSMVQVTPPPDWKPAEPSPAEIAPPPLDRVATVLPELELEPTQPTLSKTFLRGGLSAVGVGVVLAAAWFAFLRPEQKSAEPQPDSTASTIAEVKPQEPAEEIPEVSKDDEITTSEPVGSPLPQAGEEPGARADNAEQAPPSEPPQTEASATRTEEPSAAPPLAEEVKKTPPAYIDVAARLAQPVAGMELFDMPLGKAVSLLAGMGAIPITFDVESMTLLGVTPRDPISMRFDASTLGDVLQKIVEQRGLSVAVENDRVLIAAPPEFHETLRSVRYTIHDLAGDEAAATALAEMVQKLVAPESWQPSGGRGTIDVKNGVLTIHQSGDVHRRVLIFCEKLRNARHLSLRSREDPKRFSLTPRAEQGQKMLGRAVTANFHEPATLADIAAFLAETARCDILIDHVALAAMETSDRVEASMVVEKQPLGKTLDELLRPLGLTYRIVDSNTLEVTTREAAEERLDLEFYPGPITQEIIDRIVTEVSPETWSTSGGLGEIILDAPSQYLLVLQSQAIQAKLAPILRQP